MAVSEGPQSSQNPSIDSPSPWGYATAILYILSTTISVSSVQGLQRSIPDFELNVFRYIGLLLLAVAVIVIRRVHVRVEICYYKWILLGGVLNCIGNLTIFSGVGFIPVSAMEAVYSVTLMFTVVVLSRVFLNKPIGVVPLIGISLSSVGILCINQPELIFGETRPATTECGPIDNLTSSSDLGQHGAPINCTSGDRYESLMTPYTALGYTLGVVSGLSLAGVVLIFGIRLKQIDAIILCLYTSLISLPLSLMICLYFEQPVFNTGPSDLLLLMGHTVSTATAMTFNMYSCQLISPMRTTLFRSFTTVTVLIPQYTVLKHIMPGHSNWLEVMGAVCITIGVGIVPSFDLLKARHHVDDI